MNEIPKCSYKDCTREAWHPIEGEKPFCIFHSYVIKEKREDFFTAWNVFLTEHRNDIGYIHNLYCRGFVFPDDIDFSHVTFSGFTGFEGATFFRDADFAGAAFYGDAFFKDTTFSGLANFLGIAFYGDADFIDATFSYYAAFEGATFSGYAGFRSSVFNKEGIFTGANFSGATLSGASFDNCSFKNIKYTLHSKLSFQKPSKWYKLRKMFKVVPPTNFHGIETTGIIAASNRRFVRDIEDQQFITQFRTRHPRLYWLWLISCDCGRSFGLFFLWCLVAACIFGLIYSRNAEVWFKKSDTWNWITPFYYSLVTFSTLGFGDVTPRLSGGWAQFTVMVEVFLGYLGLGGLISIFANKLARRA